MHQLGMVYLAAAFDVLWTHYCVNCCVNYVGSEFIWLLSAKLCLQFFDADATATPSSLAPV